MNTLSKGRRCSAATQIAALALLAVPPTIAQASQGTAVQQAPAKHYDIPAGALDEALARYASAAGIDVAATPELTAAKRSAGLRGSYEVDEGFAALLAGTGLEAAPKGAGPQKQYELRVAAAGAGTSEPVTQGQSVQISGQAFSDSTITVNQRQIAEQAPRDTRQTLQNETGVDVGGGGNAIAQKVYVREIEDTMLNITLDGVPQGGNIFHHQGRVLIDPLMMKRIEVDKGGTLASVGPGGLAGSVRMTTKDARDLLRPGQTVGGMLLGGIESNTGWEGGGAVYGQWQEAVDFVGYFKRRNTSDYTDGAGVEQGNTAADQNSGLAKFNGYLAPRHTMSLSYLAIEDEGVRYPRPHMVGFPGSNTPMPQKLDQHTITGSYRYDGEGAIPAAELTLFSDEVENTRTNAGSVPVFGKPPGYSFGEKLDTLGANLLLQSMIGNTPLRYGLNYQDREAKAINPLRIGGAGGSSEEKADVFGLFGESSIALAADWTLDLGARYDWYGYDDNHGQSYDSHGLSPNANLSWRFAPGFSVWGGVASTLRGVGPKEIFMLDNGPGPFIYRNAPDLDPERSTNYEVGLAYDDGQWFFKGSVFQMIIDDYLALVFDTAAPIVAVRDNVGKVRSNGYELGGGWRSGPWRIDVSVADAKPKLNGYDLGDGDFSLGTTIGRTWLAGVRYALQEWNLVLGWNGRFVQSVSYQPAGATAEQHKAGYGVNDIYASWMPLGNDTLRVNLMVRNLFDQFYYDQGSYGFNAGQGMFLGYPDPGRNVQLTAAWKF